ncbi:hypothetical protein TVAG_014100 [Trichomonas vaginalis G3]|uniref:Nucleoplasmin-like domain-containing protein n=1 Tax=Trichomonas vaginalis (strain ATCC PRA-98 / G3) TaxID=412133 RepID=A2DDG4_TRIV3|nr:nucleoplasmin-like domain family [Trichomonas vaginalis G3]EAY21643.1 hypothetical protein TVAG_014100 [Trichomonas vaginalis G3]KAI5489681.1 nucleoplasmin-like domain family [Trichomonas vaginalis G3]|eukprot:XP_001582629.1 hypothetical protein [Trichomonas vaginalis G3]
MSASTTWAQIIGPGKTVTLDIPDDANMYITNVCIGEFSEESKNTPQRLLAHIITIDPYQDEDQVDVSKLPHTDIMIASLMPEEREHEVINFCFSPLNIVKLHNQGTCTIHIAGYNVPIEDEEEEEEEEEENAEEGDNSGDSPDDTANNDVDEVDEIDVQTKLLALSKNKPKPAPAQKPPPPPPQNKPQHQQQNHQKPQHQQPQQRKQFQQQNNKFKNDNFKKDFKRK